MACDGVLLDLRSCHARTASRSSSASFSLPPGSSKVERSSTFMSAQGRSCDVLAGRFHLGKGKASEGLSAEGILMRNALYRRGIAAVLL